ncbi:MAG TPA: NAD-dependent deacylase [Bacillota bacterium]|nr:NAD-dependent deacylase [Bacillota bacterium]
MEGYRLKELSQWIMDGNRVVVFTGAGMSTESGLPDFRSSDRGLWEKFNPDELANVQAIYENTDEFTSFYQYRLTEITAYKPHIGHFILGKWEERGIISSIITQNVDGFHHDAGNKHVHEIHGSFRSLYCHACGHSFSRDAFIQGEATCTFCGGVIRPGIVLFGEQLPQETFKAAEADCLEADTFIVLGSSLSVTPANMFPLIAKEQGAKLIIINRDATPYNHLADKVIQDISIKEALIQLNEHITGNNTLQW